MSLQISKLVLYSRKGELREVSFRVGKLNIITGASKTGKSAIIDIVDYCTGRNECNVADGVIREYVGWYGIVFRLGDGEIAQVHVESEENLASFVAVENSPWDNEQLAGPFPIVEFLIYATFCSSDEGDRWDTQYDEYERYVEREVNEYFRGPHASLIALLQDLLTFDAISLVNRLSVSEIRLKRPQRSEHRWEIELIGTEGQVIQPIKFALPQPAASAVS